MDGETFSAWISQRELRRARGTRLLVHGRTQLLHDIFPLLRRHAVEVYESPPYAVIPASLDGFGSDVSVLCAGPVIGSDVGRLADLLRELRLPFCVVLAPHSPRARIGELIAGARDVIWTDWQREEVFSRLVRMLAEESMRMRARSVHVTLRRRITMKSELLQETRLEMVHRLGRAAEYRDNETGQHVIRVGKFCATVAAEMGLPRQQVQLLFNASPLHDIGKIGVADAILLKNGALDRTEWEIMKQHTVIGAEILGGTDDALLETARVIALTHHERWDGRGYPAGLRKSDIPVCGRVAAVCDVYDALTSDRPYKRAWRTEEALEYLQANRGTHFDPEVVDAFMDSLPSIFAVQESHSDRGAPANVYRGGADEPPLLLAPLSAAESPPREERIR